MIARHLLRLFAAFFHFLVETADCAALKDEIQSLTIALQTSEANRLRAETDVKLLASANKNWDKLKGLYLAQRDELERVQRERDALVKELRAAQQDVETMRDAVRRERDKLEEATRLRLEAEMQAAPARLESAKRDAEHEMRKMGMSPVKSLDDVLPGTALVPTQTEKNPNDDNMNAEASEEKERNEDQQEEEDDEVVPQSDGAANAPITQIAAPVPGLEVMPQGDVAVASTPPAPECEADGRAEENQHMPGGTPSHVRGKAARNGGLAPLVMFTGYGDNQGVRLRMTRKVESLGGSVYVGKDFSDCVTHLVSPANAQPTVKV